MNYDPLCPAGVDTRGLDKSRTLDKDCFERISDGCDQELFLSLHNPNEKKSFPVETWS